VLAAGGVVLLVEGRGELNLVGFLFALAAGACWGLYILLGAALGRHTTEGNGLALGMAVAALVAVPVGVIASGTALIRPWVLFAGVGVALLSSVIPYSLDLEALRKIPPRVFGILMSLEPAMAALIGLVVLQESLHWSQWIAVLCVVAASAGATRGARPDVKPPITGGAVISSVPNMLSGSGSTRYEGRWRSSSSPPSPLPAPIPPMPPIPAAPVGVHDPGRPGHRMGRATQTWLLRTNARRYVASLPFP